MSVRTVHVNPSSELMTEANVLRTNVFVVEQGVDPAIEADGRDGSATHAVMTEHGEVVATGRMIPTGELGKVQRVAVARSQRRTGAGKEIMEALEGHGRQLGLQAIQLSSQLTAVPFYLALGYVATGPEYVEAGIVHQQMTKELTIRGKEDVFSGK
jgi:predicted GNAT family N-acyltransferase